MSSCHGLERRHCVELLVSSSNQSGKVDRRDGVFPRAPVIPTESAKETIVLF